MGGRSGNGIVKNGVMIMAGESEISENIENENKIWQ